MKIFHWSDNHGRFDKIQKFLEEYGWPDVFVMTGDFFPDGPSVFWGDAQAQAKWQEEWFQNKMDQFQRILCGTPLLYCLGNHDYGNFGRVCRDNQVEVIKVGPKGIEFNGFKWAGFGHIPSCGGFWAREADSSLMGMLIRDVEASAPDILLTHAPPECILDDGYSEEHFGIPELRLSLAIGKINPKYHFFGHVHQRGGRQEVLEGTVFVNSATTIQKIEII